MPLRPGPAKTAADEVRARSASRRRAATESSIASLEAKMDGLLADRAADREKLEEAHDEIAHLRLAVGELRRDVVANANAFERVTRELKTHAVEPISAMRAELMTATSDATSLRAQISALTTQLTAVQQVQAEHGVQLKDVNVLRTTQGFVQSAAERAEQASAEQARAVGEVRSELAGLQQRHASLASSSTAEHNAHRQAHTALRSSAETTTLQLESFTGEISALKSAEATAGETCEKLKKAAKRHELLLHRVSEVQEQRASELRTLIKTLADQLRPLHETSRRHAAQIEEVSSGINVLAELLRFTNRNRTQTLADALGSV